MDTRRKTLGRRIKRARRAAGYPSQKAFAEAIGVSETSVANAERGSELVGADGEVFEAIEARLNWPGGSIANYIETGNESAFVTSGGSARQGSTDRELGGPSRDDEPDDELPEVSGDASVVAELMRGLNDDQIRELLTLGAAIVAVRRRRRRLEQAAAEREDSRVDSEKTTQGS